MSLDVYLTCPCCEETVYDANRGGSGSHTPKTPTNQPARSTPMSPSNLSKDLSTSTEAKPMELNNDPSCEERYSDIKQAIMWQRSQSDRVAAELDRVAAELDGRIRALEGSADARPGPDPEPDAEPPYRMAEPTNFGAAVIDDGVVWRRASNGQWGADEYAYQNDWSELDDPHPYQNCTLTADDPEPPIGSVVLDRDGGMWQRLSLVWYLAGLDVRRGWNGLRAVGPVTLLYRGEA